MGKKIRKESTGVKFFIDNERPEETHGDPLRYYDSTMIQNYANSKSLMRTQEKITNRAISLSKVKKHSLVLDVGMGCGFSSSALHLFGLTVVGLDIHRGMLSVYEMFEFNPIESNFAQFSFKPNTFDAAFSISSIQWIFGIKDEIERTEAMKSLVNSLSYVLKPGGKVVIQFYPRSDDQMKEIGACFQDSGFFEGNFVVDNSDSPRKRKIYLIAEKIKR